MQHEIKLYLDDLDYENLKLAFKKYRPNAELNDLNLNAYALFLLTSEVDETIKKAFNL